MWKVLCCNRDVVAAWEFNHSESVSTEGRLGEDGSVPEDLVCQETRWAELVLDIITHPAERTTMQLYAVLNRYL